MSIIKLPGLEPRTLQYILVGHEPVPEPDVEKWGRWHDNIQNRIVARHAKGAIDVSTVFLGLDHNFMGVGPPILFETMVFGGPHDQDQERYCTWDEALLGHLRMCNLAFKGETIDVVPDEDNSGG
jgi:hypothetical protein